MQDGGKGQPGVFRPDYPAGLLRRLEALGVGVRGQRVLDAGSGAGRLARESARRGCRVTALAGSEEERAAIRRHATRENLVFDMVRGGPADVAGPFDVVACGEGGDPAAAAAEAPRLLAPGGVLAACRMRWLPRSDVVACTMEELILKFRGALEGADFTGEVEPLPPWAPEGWSLRGFFVFDERPAFGREALRGYASGVCGALPAGEAAAYDGELDRILDVLLASGEVVVRHRVWAHIFGESERTGL